MVGDEIAGGRGPAELTAGELTAAELTAAELTAGLRADYDAAAGDWADGPGPMYAPLARVLVAAAPVPLAGRLVLDLGAGGGVAGQAALAAGARQVAGVDLSEGMLRQSAQTSPGGGWRPVAADAAALPFRDGCFDLVLAAFCLNHLSRLDAGLAEARRVGAAIAASTFAPGWTHPAKDAADGALQSFGYRPPAGMRPSRPGHGPATRRRSPRTRPRPGSPGCGCRPRPSRPAWRRPPSWCRGGWAWPTTPRSCARWTRPGGSRYGVRPSGPWPP